jgi:hypothetical protein
MYNQKLQSNKSEQNLINTEKRYENKTDLDIFPKEMKKLAKFIA